MGLAAAVAAGSAILGAGASIYGADKAAGEQKYAANQANATEMDMFNTVRQSLSPYISAGNAAGNKLTGMLNSNPGGLLAKFNPTEAQLQSTPGYQFTLDQGLKAVNNANSAKGWGLSGAGMKGIADYTTGLADQTYQQQFQNYWAQNNNIYGMLSGQQALGENAAAGQGQIGAGIAGSIGANTIGAGNAGAAATIAGTNAVASAPMNSMMEYMMLNNMMSGNGGNGAFGGGAASL